MDNDAKRKLRDTIAAVSGERSGVAGYIGG